MPGVFTVFLNKDDDDEIIMQRPPPPTKKIHNFSWVLQSSLEKSKTMIMQNYGK